MRNYLRLPSFLMCSLVVFCSVPHANAWGDRGHELVAYIAYMHLDPVVRQKVDTLVQLNPCHSEWNTAVSALSAEDRPVALFMIAATWPDKIKLVAPIDRNPYDCQPDLTFLTKDGAVGKNGRFSADIAPCSAAAKQNIGYSDDRRHQYWHFIDTPVAADGVSTQPPGCINVLTELLLLTNDLKAKKDPSLNSYDLVWIEHLTGDIHQPLHDAQRFSTKFPNGDAGGNLVKICTGQRECRAELHGYWDDLPGSDASLGATIKMGAALDLQPAPKDAQIDVDHPEHWVSAAFSMAQRDAYAAPFVPDENLVDPSSIPPAYHVQAMNDMKQQIFIAGYRLMNLLNRSLAG